MMRDRFALIFMVSLLGLSTVHTFAQDEADDMDAKMEANVSEEGKAEAAAPKSRANSNAKKSESEDEADAGEVASDEEKSSSEDPTNDGWIKPMSNGEDLAQGMTVEEFLQRLSSVRNVLTRRDPFEDTEPEFIRRIRLERERRLKEQMKEQNKEPEATVVINPEDLPPLERFPTEQYQIIAVLLGSNSPRAMVRIPNGGNRIVQRGMSLGDRGGAITQITVDGVVVQEKIKNNFGNFDTEEITLPVVVSGKN